MIDDINLNQIMRKGAMPKNLLEMTREEMTAWEAQIQIDARQYLYSIGQPYVIRNKDGFIVAEYADGTVKLIR